MKEGEPKPKPPAMSRPPDTLQELFTLALNLPAHEDRSAFLRKACGDNTRLRIELEQLLRSNDRAGKFMTGTTKAASGKPPGERTSEPRHEQEGDQIGPFRLAAKIGEGGFSTVFLAEQREPVRRWAALKVVKPGMDSKTILEHFALERQALALMDHPGIARLYHSGETPCGRPYFAMEWVQGVEITAWCDEVRQTISQRLKLFVEVCRAIQHAHSRGILHRDLKPSNILVAEYDKKPQPKVIDFGIAKVIRQGLTKETQMIYGEKFLGTPSYMSPEQTELLHPQVDARADVYSLGVILCELLAGRPPLNHAELQEMDLMHMLQCIRETESRKPSVLFAELLPEEQQVAANCRRSSIPQLRRRLAGELDWIVGKALAKEKERRYASAADLADDVERYLAHRPIQAKPPTLRYRARKYVRRNRRVLIPAFVVILVLVTAASIEWRSQWRVRETTRTAEIHRQTLAWTRIQTEIDRYEAQGLRASAEKDFAKALLWFSSAAKLAADDPLRERVNRIRTRLWSPYVAIPTHAVAFGKRQRSMEFSPDGRHLAIVSSEDEAWLWDWQNEPTPHRLTREPVRHFAWNPKRTCFAIALVSGEVQLWDQNRERVIAQLPGEYAATAIAFSPDGHWLVVGDTLLRRYHLDTQFQEDERWAHPDSICAIVISPRGDQIATACTDGNARVFAVSDETEKPRLGPVPHRHSAGMSGSCARSTRYQAVRDDRLLRINRPAFSADGKKLLTRHNPYQITTWDIESGVAVRQLANICCTSPMTMSPHNHLLACGIEGDHAQIWDSESGNPHTTITSHHECVFDLSFAADEQSMITASADFTAQVWKGQEGRVVCSPLHHTAAVVNARITPDGRHAATAQVDGLVRLWRLPTQFPFVHRIPMESAPWSIRIDRSGERFVAVRQAGSNATIDKAQVFQLAGGGKVGEPMEFDGTLQDAALSPDGTLLASLSHPGPGEQSAQLCIRDITTGSCLVNHDLPHLQPRRIEWNPDGEEVAIAFRDGTIIVADASSENYRPVQEEPCLERVPSVELLYSPAGDRLILLQPDGVVGVWDSADDSRCFPPIMEPSEVINFVDLSPDGRLLVTATLGGTVSVWDANSGIRLADPLAHPSRIFAARFCPDGTRLLTTGEDGQARLWNWRDGKLLNTPFDHPDPVYDAAFSANGDWCLTACRDGAIRIWDCAHGGRMMPPLQVGTQAFEIRLGGDGSHAAFGSLSNEITLLSLHEFEDARHEDVEYLRLYGEVVAASEVHGDSYRRLDSAAWLERFNKLQSVSPSSVHTETRNPMKAGEGDLASLAR